MTVSLKVVVIQQLVLSELIKREFLQHHWDILVRSSFKARMDVGNSAGEKDKYNLLSRQNVWPAA